MSKRRRRRSCIRALPVSGAAGSSFACGLGGFRARRWRVRIAERWNGRKWSLLTSPSMRQESGLRGVSCTSPYACVAVGFVGMGPTCAGSVENDCSFEGTVGVLERQAVVNPSVSTAAARRRICSRVVCVRGCLHCRQWSCGGALGRYALVSPAKSPRPRASCSLSWVSPAHPRPSALPSGAPVPPEPRGKPSWSTGTASAGRAKRSEGRRRPG